MKQFLKPYRALFSYAMLFSLVANLLMLGPSIYFLQVYDRVLTSRSLETLVMLTALGLALLICSAFLDVTRARLLGILAGRVHARLGAFILPKMLGDTTTAPQHADALRDAATLRGFLGGSGVQSLLDLPWLPVYLLVIFLFHPLLGALALVGGLILFALTWLGERVTGKALRQAQLESRQTLRFVDAALRNAEVARALGMVAALSDAWSQRNQSLEQSQAGTTRMTALLSAWTKFSRQFVQIVMMAVGAWLVIGMNTSPGIMIAATILLGRALAPLESLIGAWKSLVEARGAYARLDELLAGSDAGLPRTELPALRGALSLDQVVFATAGRQQPVLQGISLSLSAGEAVAVIGPSGSGKSTLARLIVGAQTPTHGRVRLDGADLTQWSSDTLGRQLGYLPQDVQLLPGTIGENIARMGEMDSAGVVAAARMADAHDMIVALPQGYDTPVTELAHQLSGGQRQRIGLARALYGNPRLVVLDEPNTHLDAEGEAALSAAIKRVRESGATLILVTHRPAMLEAVDKVLVIKNGQIAAFGPRQDVVSQIAPRFKVVGATQPA